MDQFAMHRAAEAGDLQTIQHLARKGISLATLDDHKYTPLHFAAKCGHFEVTEFLISQKIDLDLKTEDGSTAVMEAAAFGHQSIVELLLRSGANADGCSKIGKWTLLHHACRRGWTDTVKHLHDKVELDVETTLQMTPLLVAASEGHGEIVEFLLEAGADVHRQDFDRWTVLHYASKKGWLQIVQQITEIARPYLMDSTTSKKMTPVLLAASEGHKEVVEFLIETGAAVDCRDDAASWTVLHYACKWNWLQIVEKIVQTKKWCIKAVISENFQTPLKIASGMHHTEIVKELLRADAITTYDSDTINELQNAARYGNLESLQHLVQLGVDIDTWIPLDFSYTGLYKTPLHYAAQNDQLATAHFLISNNCDINPKNRYNETPIWFAAERGHKEFVNMLVRHGADINGCPKKSHKTILHTACANNWKDTVEYILQTGKANIEAKDEKWATPLIYAAEYDVDCDISRLLLQAGANVKACENLDNTALHFACDNKNAELVKMLLSAGADANVQNCDNDTPLRWAVDARCSLEIIKLLIEHNAYFTNYDEKYYDMDEDELPRQNELPRIRKALKSLVMKDVDLCTRLIMNKFKHHSLPEVYKNPEYAQKQPKIDKLCIGNGVKSGIEGFVESEIERNTYCNVMKVRPPVLTLMCVEALISPQTTEKKISAQVQITGTDA